MFLQEVCATLKEFKVPFAVFGKHALLLHGIQRPAKAVSLLVSFKKPHLLAAELALQKIGLQSRLPIRADDVFRFRKEYIKKRNLRVWSFVDFNDADRAVDILMTVTTTDVQLSRVLTDSGRVPVVSLKALLQIKKASSQTQDRIDARAIEDILYAQKK